jgi:hypothetical protein
VRELGASRVERRAGRRRKSHPRKFSAPEPRAGRAAVPERGEPVPRRGRRAGGEPGACRSGPSAASESRSGARAVKAAAVAEPRSARERGPRRGRRWGCRQRFAKAPRVFGRRDGRARPRAGRRARAQFRGVSANRVCAARRVRARPSAPHRNGDGRGRRSLPLGRGDSRGSWVARSLPTVAGPGQGLALRGTF